MLVADPKARISLTQLKDHPWLAVTGLTPRPNFTVKDSAPEGVDNPPIVTAELDEDANEEEDENDDDIGAKSSSVRPMPLNAFNLVPKAGGFLLERLFAPDKFANIQPTEATNPDSVGAAGIIRYGISRKAKTHKYTSHVTPPEDLFKIVYNLFVEKGFSFTSTCEETSTVGRAKGSIITARGGVGVSLAVYELCNSLSLMEISKGKGDLLEWDNIFKDIEDKMSPFVNIPVAS